MKDIKIIVAILSIAVSLNLQAQINTNEQPLSFNFKAELFKYADNDVKTMSVIDIKKLTEEDKVDEAHGIPPRFGFRHKVNLNTQNSGKWYDLEDGSRMWRLVVIFILKRLNK